MIDSEQQEVKTIQLIELLKAMEEPGLSDEKIRLMSEQLRAIYLSDSGELYRHSYSQISYYMYENHRDNGIPSEAKATLIIEYLNEIARMWEIDSAGSEENQGLYNALGKLIDHISLEGIHLSQMADIYYKLAKADTLNQQLESVVKKMETVAYGIQNIRIIPFFL